MGEVERTGEVTLDDFLFEPFLPLELPFLDGRRVVDISSLDRSDPSNNGSWVEGISCLELLFSNSLLPLHKANTTDECQSTLSTVAHEESFKLTRSYQKETRRETYPQSLYMYMYTETALHLQ